MDNVIFHSMCTGTRDGVDTRSPKGLTVACDDTQELACDSCGAIATNEWESKESPGAKVYAYCDVCWYHMRDDTQELACDSCGAIATNEWESKDGPGAKVYAYCDVCWYHMRDSVDELSEQTPCCDFCELRSTELKQTDDYDGYLGYTCKACWVSIYCDAGRTEDQAVELFYMKDRDHPLYYRNPPHEETTECECCAEKPASETFNHLDGRSFQLCSDCFGIADHSDDYGADFGSTPRLRKTGLAKLCDCPLPCDFVSPTHCELCDGIVVLHKEE